jgi:aldose 1-epimerase
LLQDKLHCWKTAKKAKQKEHNTMNITKKAFGRFWNSDVTCYTLENPGGVTVSILDYGAIIQALKVPGRTGYADIVLGFDTLYDYLKGHPFFGAIAGRVANRIPDGLFVIDGREYKLSVNAPFHNHLHGGFRGFDKYVWHSEPFKESDRVGLRLHRISPNGEEGYPGALDTKIIYWLDSDNVLGFEVRATTDQPTIVNIVQHSYLNMAGHDSGDVTGQELSIAADQVTPTDERLRPTGAITNVVDTVFDLRTPTRLEAAFEKAGGVFDINYVLNQETAGMRPCARLHDPASGRTLTIATTQPGVQFYNAHKLFDQEQIGKGGHRYPNWAGICLETQAFPNAVNHDNFPSMVVRPGEPYHHKTTYMFSIE